MKDISSVDINREKLIFSRFYQLNVTHSPRQACVAALAAAEADADAYYAGLGYPYAYGYVPFGSSSGLDPITQGLDPATQGYVPYYGYGYHGLGYAYWG